MRLRPYQIDLVSRVGAALAEHRSVLLQLPTGGGKTHIAAHVAGVSAAVGERVWMIAHRREIVGQTSRSMAALGIPHGVVAAGRPFEPDRPVQVCAIDSLTRRAEALPTPDLMIWDEAHHVVAKSWAALRARFPEARHLGLTATPERLDGKGLGAFFAELICGPTTAELMAAGHLSPYRLFAPTIPDLRGIDVRAGDWARDQLAERMSGATLVGDAVEHYRRYADGARAIAFCVTVEASRALAARFNAAGIPATHVGGDTPGDERDAAIADLEAGRLRVLTNVEVFTEGFDLPAIDAVILLRPTRSLALHRQMVGRGLRTAPGKGATVILDHAGLFYDHGLPDEAVDWTLNLPTTRLGALGVERLRRCPECSAVHTLAPSCPECGHAYNATDRTIREVYGELLEVSDRRHVAPPSGFDTIRGFARRANKDPSNVRRMFAQGLPHTVEGYVPLDDGLVWLQRRRTSHRQPPPGSRLGEYEMHSDFARRVGISRPGVAKMVARGLPAGSNGWVHIERGLAWLADDRAQRTKPTKPPRPTFAGETIALFAARLGVSEGTVRTAKRRGLPTGSDGLIAVERALDWWGANPPSTKGRNGPDGYESVKAFCRRVGVSETGGRRGMVRRGLPIASNGFIHIETGLAWVKENGARQKHQSPER